MSCSRMYIERLSDQSLMQEMKSEIFSHTIATEVCFIFYQSVCLAQKKVTLAA